MSPLAVAEYGAILFPRVVFYEGMSTLISDCQSNAWKTTRCASLRQAFARNDAFWHYSLDVSFSPGPFVRVPDPVGAMSNIFNADSTVLFFERLPKLYDTPILGEIRLAGYAFPFGYTLLAIPSLLSVGTPFRSCCPQTWVILNVGILALLYFFGVKPLWPALFQDGWPLASPYCESSSGEAFTEELIPEWHHNITLAHGFGSCSNLWFEQDMNLLENYVSGFVEAVFQSASSINETRARQLSIFKGMCTSPELRLPSPLLLGTNITNTFTSVGGGNMTAGTSLYEVELSFLETCKSNIKFGAYADVILLRVTVLATFVLLYVVVPLFICDQNLARLGAFQGSPPSATVVRWLKKAEKYFTACLSAGAQSFVQCARMRWESCFSFCTERCATRCSLAYKCCSILNAKIRKICGRVVHYTRRHGCACCRRGNLRARNAEPETVWGGDRWTYQAMVHRSALSETAFKEVVRKGSKTPLRMKRAIWITSITLLWLGGRHAGQFLWMDAIRQDFDTAVQRQPDKRHVAWCPILENIVEQQRGALYQIAARNLVDRIRKSAESSAERWASALLANATAKMADAALTEYMKTHPELRLVNDACCTDGGPAAQIAQIDCTSVFPTGTLMHDCIQKCADKVLFVKCLAEFSGDGGSKIPDGGDGSGGLCSAIPEGLSQVNLVWWEQYDVNVYLHWAIMGGMNGALVTVLLLYAVRTYCMVKHLKRRCRLQAQTIATFFHPELGFPLSTERFHGGSEDLDGGMPWPAILSINPHASLQDHPKKSLKYEDFEFAPALLGTFLFTSVGSLSPSPLFSYFFSLSQSFSQFLSPFTTIINNPIFPIFWSPVPRLPPTDISMLPPICVFISTVRFRGATNTNSRSFELVCRGRSAQTSEHRDLSVYLLAVKANINGDVGAKTDRNIIC